MRVYFLVEPDPRKHKRVKAVRQKHEETLFKRSGASYLRSWMRNLVAVALFWVAFQPWCNFCMFLWELPELVSDAGRPTVTIIS